MTLPPPSVEQLTRALSAVDHLIVGIRDDQWSAPTPCTDWTVHDLVNHLVGVNLVFAALLRGQTPPELGADHLGDNPAGAYRDSGVAAQAAFDQPGVLERTYQGPRGAASGAERLHVRIVDLLAHGWDLARATGQPAELPEELAEQALAFSQTQLATMPRTGRFGPAQTVADDAPAIDRLVAFLGRPVSADR
ncbi:MAG: TIGR03086 family metal-binding protein [Pseudonocardiaceae bacterium]